MQIKFRKFHLTNGEIKVRVFYDIDCRIDKKKCVLIGAMTENGALEKIFPKEYIKSKHLFNFDELGIIYLLEDHPLYLQARKVVEEKWPYFVKARKAQ